MQLQEIYQLAIRMGVEADPRGPEGVQKALERVKEQHAELPPDRRQEFDQEDLTNPYADTRILYGDPSREVARVMAGIDITGSELLLADRLRQKGEPLDLVIAHHPQGAALVGLDQVMELQADLAAQYGVPINIAEALLRGRIAEVRRIFLPRNNFQFVDMARILDIPLMCVHTPADNLVFRFLTRLIEERKPETLREVLQMLKEAPEYAQAIKDKMGPTLFVGEERNRAGRVVPIEITGGTEGAKEMYEKMAQAGVGTIIAMHASEEHRKEAEKNHINLVIAGHISSDSLGMNLFLDELERRGVSILPCSGLMRVSRA